MKKLALVLLLVAGVASPALAGPIGDTGTFNWTRQAGYYTGSGGEFTVYAYSANLNNLQYSPLTSDIGPFDPSFQTFCLELGEFAAQPSNFVVNSAAVLGGVGGSPDPLSQGSAWLYRQFVNGALASYFGGIRPDEAGLLQNAIWMLEQEVPVAANPYYALALANGGTADATPGYLGIYVLNNYYVGGGLAQDFLWAGPPQVPDGGATLMLLGGALVGLGALRRKLRR